MKNPASIAIVVVLLVANGVFAAFNLGAASTINSDQAKISDLTSANTSMQSGLASLQSSNTQAQTALAAVQAAVDKLTSQTSSAASKYGTVMNSINPVVVKINATGTGLRGFASGVLVSSNGYVLTVLHNVTGARSITVTLSTGEQFTGTLSATDTVNNLALIKLTSTRTDFPAAARGSMSTLQNGQIVISASYPLSDELHGPATFDTGIVSALRTDIPANYFIQSDADIAQGSGGGGLFTMDGKLVGIASLGIADGIYDYIPVDAAATLLTGANIT
ncbi:serine protease Do [Dehalogenimonas formicexedens]|uniref:Serine protease Do n=1 Tax=Dehalogenimonas formicexedens TaxID=1839801 RepID=A0A1P8FA93_9CHLR|nr:trypsin-like peptidase domain-containing protein [Dehalogenimonas formicexedens]APV45386.1 serine protease Do [Dehalogenimonas formicexedens]